MESTAFAFEKTLQNKTKKDILADRLVSMITDGLLRDGDVLPSERDLAQLFGVSRETVRGAISQVSGYGLINVSQGAKSRICATESELGAYRKRNMQDDSCFANRFDIESVFESRFVVEGAIARRAAMNIDDEGIQALENMLEAQAGMFDAPVLHFQLSDESFHKLISEYARNDILAGYSEDLFAFGLKIRRLILQEPGGVEQSYREHCHIVEALKLRDPDAAERAMLAHLDSIYRTTRARLSQS
ncbi:FadR/GntR family transcriptional regulator [Halomonas cupida]|uniref:GntR family transcriptional regulator n=1 Tax=Halomonas cupida TaxID=44933 RepID=A0A1M7GMN6_9GAMM|nr:FCD domain-containing protein [Halomonas cupida]GEN23854.1 GntR family transcriptional regulator [Halomonas cupida]SHM17177.1 transcriptional regulator, GntR family [Halomonas cupida]